MLGQLWFHFPANTTHNTPPSCPCPQFHVELCTHARQGLSVLWLFMQTEFEKALGPPNNPSASPTKGPPTPQAVAEGLTTDVSAMMLPSETLSPPVMYTSTAQTSEPSSFNARASWLVGKPVHGNAYLTYTKIRHTGWLVPAVVFNSDFTLRVFWQWVHGLLPEVEYVNRAGSALVSRLPCVFRWVCKGRPAIAPLLCAGVHTLLFCDSRKICAQPALPSTARDKVWTSGAMRFCQSQLLFCQMLSCC